MFHVNIYVVDVDEKMGNGEFNDGGYSVHVTLTIWTDCVLHGHGDLQRMQRQEPHALDLDLDFQDLPLIDLV